MKMMFVTNAIKNMLTRESQTEQIASLNQRMSDLMAVLASKPAGAEANTTRINSVNFPDDVLDINKEAESDISHFL